MMRGLSLWPGSQISLNSRNACTSVSPNMIGRNSDFARPSPCSPLSEPPYLTTSFDASIRNSRHCLSPGSLRRSKVMRAWMQPSPKWP